MAACPNKASEAWKLLVSSRGEDMAYYLWDKYKGEVPESESGEAIVKAGLKSVNILQSDKAKDVFSKGEKNNWSLDKILSELQIPKEQKQLILDLGISDREQLALELASKYSYSIEINTAKKDKRENLYDDKDGLGDLIEKDVPTQYYSNLTVPGGTNYTENEISTPLITPSIKGHAQFSTDNGIGWFRSDDKIEFLDKEDLIKKGIIKQIPCG